MRPRAAIDHSGERGRHVGAAYTDRRHRLGELLDEHLLCVLAADREFTRKRKPYHQRQRIQIAASIELIAARLFGAHEFRRSDHCPDARQS